MLLANGIVPSNFKIAVVQSIKIVSVMIHTIIVLSLYYIVFQKFWKNVLQADYSLFFKNNFLYEYRFWFTPGRNTTDAILLHVDYIVNYFENNTITCGIFLDIFKVFYTMDYSILLRRLSKYGICGIALKWFKRYLSERYRYVFLDSSFSS